MKFTTEQIDTVRKALLKAGISYKQAEIVYDELVPPAYHPAMGQVYAYRFNNNGKWDYNCWQGYNVFTPDNLTRRPLTLSERGLI